MAARATCKCGWARTYPNRAQAEYNAGRHVCKTAGARRATRRHRCVRCGFEATYPDAAATQARYWFDRHSCQKQEQLMLRSALAQQRDALIDRTPRPCLHKVANHQHGTYACYVLDKCRCHPCSKANRDYESNRKRQQAYGRWNQWVPAGPVREHCLALMDAGMGLKRIGKVSGVAHGSLSKMMYGVYAPGPAGRNGNGVKVREPSRRISRVNAEKILAIDPDWSGEPFPLADGAVIPAHGTVLRVRALVALGWSQSKLAASLGIQRSNFRLAGTWQTTVGTARRVAELYDELSMTLPPENTRHDRVAASRARNFAADRGWLPPLALNDDRLDDPGYEPWIEHGVDEHEEAS